MIKENGWDWDLARPGPAHRHLDHLCCAATGSCDSWQMGRNGPPGTLWSAGRRDNILLNSLLGDISSLTWILFVGNDYTALKWDLFWVKSQIQMSGLGTAKLNTMTRIVDVDFTGSSRKWNIYVLVTGHNNGVYILFSNHGRQQATQTRNFEPIGLILLNRKAHRYIFKVCTCLIGTVFIFYNLCLMWIRYYTTLLHKLSIILCISLKVEWLRMVFVMSSFCGMITCDESVSFKCVLICANWWCPKPSEGEEERDVCSLCESSL